MSLTDQEPDGDTTNHRPSLLMVSTVSATIRGFLTPYAIHFRAMGWRVDAAANGAASDARLEDAFDEVHELPLSRSIFDIRGILSTLRSLSRVLGNDYDIVHVHTPIAAFVTRAAIRRMPATRRPAVVYTAHGFHFYPRGGLITNLVFRTAERLAGRWTDRLVVINAVDHAAALRHRIVPRRRLVLMPGIGVDTQWYDRSRVPPTEIDAARERLGIDGDTPMFALVGELSRRKRPYDVVAALGLMTNREAHLAIVGDGPELPRVEAAIDEAGVGDRAHLVGVLVDVRPAIAASTALVLASRMEGLPRCVMEAMSLEVPVVATDARGSPDLVEPDAGIIVPVGDVPALARAMDRIVADPQAARTMASRGRSRVVEQYDLPILIAAHEALYRDVLAERSR
jgi:glycosyltransferase involved in cell wall biosynthesis